MNRWEYLELIDNNFVKTSSHIVQSVCEHLKRCFPNMKPGDIKIDSKIGIRINGLSDIEVLNALGVDGWELTGLTRFDFHTFYLLKRPVS